MKKIILREYAIKQLIIFLLLICTATVSCAETEHETHAQPFSISGWKEVLVSVRDLGDYNRFFSGFENWKLVKQGDVPKEQIEAWQLQSSVSAKYSVFANDGTESGFIRLVEFDGAEQVMIRPGAQSWDTGGIFDINMRTHDLDALAKNLREQGWQARSPVTQFSFGPFVVKEWIPQNSDGLAVAFIQRVAPQLEGWPHFKSLSRTFNSTQVVKDMPKSLEFYEDVLGFKRYLEHEGASKEEGENVLGLPHNLTTKVPRSVVILNPHGTNEGSVELLSFDGAVGRDNSGRAHLPNIGIAALSFPVVGLDALQSHFEKKGLSFVHKLTVIDGKKKLIVRAPEGAWLEFYE